VQELFDPANWSDLIHDSSFWNTAFILLIAGAALVGALYADSIRAWRAQRQERIKWMFWNRKSFS
jgi:hypothetical protein